ncbi:hypothetical protein H1Q59_08600 [Holosporaceae bacterium 'Namur']|nr:hypothetical protein [Holosporaceae bacterium 'Namur']
MKEQKEAKERKRVEEEQKFSGLVNLRALAQSFKEDYEPNLTRIQKVEAAIEALQNIKEFMNNVSVQANFEDVKGYNQEQHRSTVKQLLVRFIS